MKFLAVVGAICLSPWFLGLFVVAVAIDILNGWAKSSEDK